MKSSLIDATRSYDSFTENGAITHSTSNSNLLDLFFKIGASRKATEKSLIDMFNLAYNENPLYALKILFWSRDIRGGAGERRIFRIIFTNLTNSRYAKKIIHLLKFIPEYGRFDDLVYIFENTTNNNIKEEISKILFHNLLNGNKLCGKWMPRKGLAAKNLRNEFNKLLQGQETITAKKYRQFIVAVSDTVEQKMCSKDWDNINFNHVPSVAIQKYKKAFLKNANEKFLKWVESLKQSDSQNKINAGAIYPYTIINSLKPFRYGGNKDISLLEMSISQWENLPNYLENENVKFLPVVDVSGSMESKISDNSNITCMDVAVSLGLYIAEKNKSIFQNSFITFSENPKMQYLNGADIFQKYLDIVRAEWGYSTNIQSVFNLLLNSAVRSKIPASDMPTHILILSDKEFNTAISSKITNYENIKMKYADSGYELPNIVFWNIQSRNNNIPVKLHDNNTALISGFSPAILKSLLKGSLNPWSVLEDTILSNRYEIITI